MDLKHDPEVVRGFYRSLNEPAVIGIEASSRARWFENMLAEMGHELFVGNPVLIRKRATSRHKNDARDAELILGLLMRGEFPAIWRRPLESDQVIDVLMLRHRMVRQRTQVYNRLQTLAHSAGLPKGRIRTVKFQELIRSVEMDEAASLAREQYFALCEALDGRLAEVERWLKAKAEADPKVELLQTQKGVGYLTALITVHTLGDLGRFKRVGKEVVSFAGLDPVERSSAGRIRFGGVSKAGSSILRYHLGQAAQIASRLDVKLKSFYKRLSKKKPKAVAKTAVARKLLVKLAIMLRDNINADEFDQRGRTVGNAREARGLK
jgi:transposase